MMLDALHHFTPDIYNDTTWVLLLDASEEANGEHFGQICRQRLAGPHTLAGLIFEGGRLEGQEAQLVVARKGMAVYHVTVAGKAAHAGASHEQGANAIVQMAETVRQIASFTDYDRQITFNVGTIAGGTVVNRVPHFATATVEMRAFDQAVYEEGMAKMLALSGQASVVSGNGQYPCRISVAVNHTMPPWPRNAATDRLFAVWQAAAEALGLRALPEERGGLSDGNYFWQEIPTLDGLGPAGGNAHCSERSPDGSKEQEFVRPGSFIPKTLLNTTAVLALLRNETP
jgi:glutamate carboxypeptidase